VQLPDYLESAFLNGRSVGPVQSPAGRVRVYGTGGRFLGLALVDAAGGAHPKRLLTVS
jgi:tRNA pseudouridine synthase B-like protein